MEQWLPRIALSVRCISNTTILIKNHSCIILPCSVVYRRLPYFVSCWVSCDKFLILILSSWRIVMGFHSFGISIGKFLSGSLGDSLILPRIFLVFERNRKNWNKNVT